MNGQLALPGQHKGDWGGLACDLGHTEEALHSVAALRMAGADGLATGLTGFGPLAVMGGRQVNAAGAVPHPAGMAGIAAEGKRIVLDRLTERGLSRGARRSRAAFSALSVPGTHPRMA